MYTVCSHGFVFGLLSRWEALLRGLKISKASIRRCVAAELLYRKQALPLVAGQKQLQQLLGQTQHQRETLGMLPAVDLGLSSFECAHIADSLQRNLAKQQQLAHEHYLYCISKALTSLEVSEVGNKGERHRHLLYI